MDWQAWFSLGVVGFVFGLLVFTRIAPDIVLLAGLTLLIVSRVVTPEQALSGLANPGMVTVGVLFVVAAGIRETGGIDWMVQHMLGRPKTATGGLLRLLIPVGAASAFMNNTPLVAMLIPAVNDWAKQQRISPSKLMIPLSYGAILGGTCTLIGTSTNIVVNGLVITHFEGPGLGMFDIAWVGLPCAAVGFVYLIFTSPWLLPERRAVISELDDPREYAIEMLVADQSPLVGQTIEKAGLRHLPGVYLAEIDREGMVLPAVSPQERLRAGDRLVFVGVVESVVDLQKIRGLTPATDQVFKLAAPRADRCFIEAVISPSSPLVGKTIRDGRFRTVYNAVVVAVARGGQRVRQKIGDIVLLPTDTLLIEAQASFADQHRNSRDFLLVSRLDNSNPPRHERALVSLVILAAMVISVAMGWISILPAALVAAGMMVFTRCCTATVARRSVDWQVLVAIAASFGIAEALEQTEAAKYCAENLIGLVGRHPWTALAVVYAVTLLATELITNNAAAVLMFPLALATAGNLNVNEMPFIVAVMMAASAGFATPIGYQTNLMVYGPGGYRTSDYLKIGLPLDFLIGVVAVTLIPYIPGWGF